MRSRWIAGSAALVASGVVIVALGIGCASILSIPDRSLAPDAGADSGHVVTLDAGSDGPVEWCDRPENKHSFCDDFDHPDAGAQWTNGASDGSAIGFAASTDTPPTALDLSTTPEPLGVSAVSGLYYPFTQPLDHVRMEVDLRLVSLDLESEGGLSSELGFMLLEQTGFCLGVVLTPAGIGTVMRYQTTDCTDVTNLPADAGPITDDAGLTSFAIVAPVPNLNTWYHLALDLKRNADGSGTVDFDINYPGRRSPPQIPAGYLTDAAPAIAVATSVVGPSGNVELMFDNVTFDFLPN
jgi:hypothetical protein